jgi:predicted O-linked N-acetylglucosamine transferase (SPINDLY family)
MNWFSSVFRRKAEAAAPPDREALDARLRAGYDQTLQGNLEEAQRLYRNLLEDDPRDADALHFLAVIALASDRSLEARDLSQKAIDIRPNDSAFWFVLAVACQHQRQLQEAVDAWRSAVRLDPDYALARNNFGALLVDNGDYEEGREELEKLLAAGYETAQVRYNLCVVYRAQGRIAEAIAACQRAIELTPDDKSAYTNLLLTLNYSDKYDAAGIFDEHRRFGARFAKPYVEPPLDRTWPRRLRVGYVSPDFRNHVVMCFVEPIIARHDRSRVEVFCYHTLYWQDHATERLRKLPEHWVDAGSMSDAQLLERIRADRIDILVDLTGHTGDNRLLVFTQKPAPVQATYLGYPGTTGISAIDYRISDARADPPGEADRLSAERIVRPWPTYFCYRLPEANQTPDCGPLPAHAAGHITFGCFNNLPKVSDAFIDAASQVLAAVPGSRMILKSRTLSIPVVADRYREQFRKGGIDPSRVELRGWEASFGGHLNVYREIDIALDSLPYNGATTSCESLWMGVPVVSLSGDRHAGRMGSSILAGVGLEELVTYTVPDYVRTAVALAGDLPRLEALREGLRERMRRAMLTDETGFTRALEDCYIDMWQKKIAPQSSSVELDDRRIEEWLRQIAALRAEGRKIEAEETCKEILKIRPDHMEALSALWDLSYETQNHGVAVEWLRRGISANDRIAQLHYMMGYSLMGQGNMKDAAASLRAALALDPAMAKAQNNLGCALEATGALGEATECYRKAISLDPRLADALYNLGNAHRQAAEDDRAIEYISQALQLQSGRADWQCNLGDLLVRKLRLDEAVASYEAALKNDPDDARAYDGRARALLLLGRAQEADADFRRALELKPDNAHMRSDWLLSLHYWRGAEPLLEEHLAWTKRHAQGLGRQAARAPHERRPKRRMNIGYFSPDFKQHSVASFIEPLLAAHDRSRFKIFCYSNVAFPDEVTKRISESCEEWRNVSRLGEDWIADVLRSDRIDILVDLAGHTGEGRPLLFARKLAPVQVTWLGYPNTTGIDTIDYRLTDAVADPEGDADRVNVEKLVRLPGGFLCYAPPPDAPELAQRPLAGPGRVTFGCFNNLAKLTPGMIALWARLLGTLPDARLHLKSFGLAAESARRSIRQQFADLGVGAERLELSGPAISPAAHLAKYQDIDIALDVYPYNGVATTCEALWMGVPLITLAGPTHVSRVGASILHGAGLSELVADSEDGYLRKAAELARDLERLGTLRRTMRERLRASPLLDARGFAGNLENAYREMWDRWVQGQEDQEAAQPPLPSPAVASEVN